MSVVTILFISANPNDLSVLKLGEEIHQIDKALLPFKDNFVLQQQWEVRFNELAGTILRFNPDIIHFSGHGTASSEIILVDNSGFSRPVSSVALRLLFHGLNTKNSIKCVVLNACYSEKQAEVIAQDVDCVVGMSKTTNDDASINFSTSFYQALAYGKSVQDAFTLGLSQYCSIDPTGQNVVHLIPKKGVDPQTISFLPGTRTSPPKIIRSLPILKLAEQKNNQGMSLLQGGNYFDEAAKLFDEAIKLNPQMAIAWNNKGLSFLLRYEIEDNPSNRGLLDQALSCFDEALRIDSRLATAWCNKGQALFYSYKGINYYPAAIAYIPALMVNAFYCSSEATRLEPRMEGGWNTQGLILFDLYADTKNEDLLNQAINDFNKTLEINPQNTSALNNKGYAFFIKCQLNNDVNLLKEAINLFNAALSANPGFGPSRKFKADAEEMLNDWVKRGL